MSDSPISKAAKKNQRRAEKRAKERAQKLREDGVIDRLMHENDDPVENLKTQLQEAKNNKDHKLAAKLRKDLWMMQDKLAGHLPPEEMEDGPPLPDDPTKQENLAAGEVKSSENLQEQREKKLRGLKKKLQQIEKLKCKQENGEALEDLQVAKIESEQRVLKEIEEVQELINQEAMG